MSKIGKKATFILYKDIMHMVKKLPQELSGALFVKILEYVNGIDVSVKNENLAVEVIFEQIKNNIDANHKKYQEKIVARNRENGKKGGRPKLTQEKPKEPSGLFNNPENPDTDTDTDTESVSVTVTDIIIDTDKKARYKKIVNSLKKQLVTRGRHQNINKPLTSYTKK